MTNQSFRPNSDAVISRPSVDPNTFTTALAGAANSVSIVSTNGTAGQAGLTVSSMCSVCAEPPVILVCVSRDNEFCEATSVNKVFCVNLLSSTQQNVANVFAGQCEDPDADRFASGDWMILQTGAPALAGALTSLDCELTAIHPHGTHNIYIGRVVALIDNDESPLVYCNRAYAKVSI